MIEAHPQMLAVVTAGIGAGTIDSWPQMLAVVAAGIGAGTINTVVGSGTLITFPTLLAFGVPPVVANVSNTVGLVPGALSGAYADRESLRGQGPRLRHLMPASFLGALIGAGLLLWLPSGAFDAIVPALIGLGVVLVVLGPAISRRVVAAASPRGGLPSTGAWWVRPAVLLAGVYGGYFGAAQGVLLMSILGIGVEDTMRRHNVTKNVLSAVANGVAAAIFIVLAQVNWLVAALIAIGAVIGGQIGARIGKRLPPTALRAVIVTVGVVAIFNLLRG